MVGDMKKYLFRVNDFFSEASKIMINNTRAFFSIVIVTWVIDLLLFGVIAVVLASMLITFNITSINFILGVLAAIGLMTFRSVYVIIGSQYIIMNHVANKKVHIPNIFRFVMSRFFRYIAIESLNVILAIIIISAFSLLGVFSSAIMKDGAEVIGAAYMMSHVAFFVSRLILIRITFSTQSTVFFNTGVIDSYKTSIRATKGFVFHVLKHTVIVGLAILLVNYLAEIINANDFLASTIVTTIVSVVKLFGMVYMSLLFLNIHYYDTSNDSDNQYMTNEEYRSDSRYTKIYEDIPSKYNKEKYDGVVPFHLSNPKSNSEDLYKFDPPKQEEEYYKKDEDLFYDKDEDDFF